MVAISSGVPIRPPSGTVATGGIEASRKAAKATVPLGGRMGTPEEIATMALWLLSDEASYVTAAVYDVSAGR